MKQKISSWLPQTKGAKIMAGCLAAYFLLFFWLACRKFDACTGDTNDISQLDCAYYMTLHGKFLWMFSMCQSYFEIHAEPLMLMVMPLFAVFPSPKTLLFTQTLCITVAAIPVYLIARKALEHEAGGVLMALAFLLCPSLVGQNINQAQTAVFPLPFLLFAFYFFQEERLFPYVICLAIACLGKENVPLTALMFAPYALWRRRSLKWVIAAVGVPLCALGLSLGVIRPMFAKGATYNALEYYPGFGNSLGQFVMTILTDWGKVSNALFTGANGQYVAFMLLAAGLVLPFLAPELIFIAPESVLNLLSSNTGMKVPVWLYNIYVGTFLMMAAMYGAVRVGKWLKPRLGEGKYGPVIAGGLLLLGLANWWQWFRPQEYQLQPQYAAQQAAFAMIPDNDSLLAGPGPIIGHVSHREVLITSHMHELEFAKKRMDRIFKLNWVIFDMNYRVPQPGWFVPPDLFYAYARNPDYEVVFQRDNVFVFKRRVPFPPTQMPRVTWAEVAG